MTLAAETKDPKFETRLITVLFLPRYNTGPVIKIVIVSTERCRRGSIMKVITLCYVDSWIIDEIQLFH